MASTLDDFLNEINQIAPLKTKEPKNVWKECFDEKSGFSYYWNTKTDEVSWQKPQGYIDANEAGLSPKSAPVFPGTNLVLPTVAEPFKIYKIGDDSISTTTVPKAPTFMPTLPVRNVESAPLFVPAPSATKRAASKKIPSRFLKPSSDSEDEKITLISSYGEDSDSESSDSTKNSQPQIITGQQKEAKVVVKKTGISLLTGYSSGSDEEEEEEEPLNPLGPVLPTSRTTFLETPETGGNSTLFPIVKPIEVSDFCPEKLIINSNNKDTSEKVPIAQDVAPRAFQRKRKIGIDLGDARRIPKPPEEQETPEQQSYVGFGAKPSTVYSNFTSGGIQFAKGETLKPSEVAKISFRVEENGGTDETSDKKAVVDTYNVLNEKLKFLCEGHAACSPVQVMAIQIQTLFTAMTDGGLKLNYLNKWLSETSEELIKLENDAAPEGWILKWDREQKRYYYQNSKSGECQWDYPRPDKVVCEEEMDICTTPPREVHIEEPDPEPPLPPQISSPSPPPPPIISKEEEEEMLAPPAPKISKKFDIADEPLPPGVDATEHSSHRKKKSKEKREAAPPTPDKLTNALDSFYSDIAAIESTSASSPKPEDENTNNEGAEVFKKKKKTKVKLGPGISMKKKEVSKLVEKWKNVQQHF